MLVITVQTNHTPNTHTLKMNSRAQHSPYLPKWTRDVRCTQTQSYGNVEKAIKCVVLIFLAKMRYLLSLLTLCILDDDSIERSAEQTFLITFRFAASRLLTIYLSISLSLIYLFFVVAKYMNAMHWNTIPYVYIYSIRIEWFVVVPTFERLFPNIWMNGNKNQFRRNGEPSIWLFSY